MNEKTHVLIISDYTQSFWSQPPLVGLQVDFACITDAKDMTTPDLLLAMV
jgi:hypothetical protein